MRNRHAFVVCALALALAAADSAAQTGPNHGAVPVVHSVRATSAIVVDGALTDEVWLRAVPVTSFTQRDPEEGKPVSEATELRIAYDEAALYVGVRLLDREPARIARQLARRDQNAEADSFSLFLDAHHDHVTGATFSVSAAGVQRDATIYNDSWTDDSWDAVWESAVKIDDTGWVAEMRIPYSQLRFSRAAQLTFGINAMRYIQRKKEEAWLVHVPKTESGLASRMGHLDGLDGVAPRRTVELVPYAVTRAEYVEPEDGDPFNDGARAFAGTGVDLKYRMTSSLSLDGTVNPDFGQVEVDPAVVNLTAFETFFEEKRPFFIEGANIFSNFGRGGANNFWGFNRAEPLLFYSRRIGRAPQGSASGDFVEQPTATTILGAAKVTGKTRRGWSVGMLDAVTGREWATAVTGDVSAETEVEPLSNYMVGRAEKELGRRAAIGAIATAVNRDLREPSLRDDLPAQSYVGGADGYLFLDGKRDWVINGRIARQSALRQHQRDHAAAECVAALLRPARCGACRARSRRDLARRLDRQREPESQRGCPSGQRGPVGSESRLRFERRRLHVLERSRRDARRLSVEQSQCHALRAPSLPGCRQVVHLEFRGGPPGRRRPHVRQCRAEELLVGVRERRPVPERAGRSGHPWRALDAPALF